MVRISTFRAAKTKMKGKSFKPYPSGSGSTMFMFIFRSHILTIFRVTHFFYFLLHRGYFEMNTDRQPLNSLHAALFYKYSCALQIGLHTLILFPKGKYLWEGSDTFTTLKAISNILLVWERGE